MNVLSRTECEINSPAALSVKIVYLTSYIVSSTTEALKREKNKSCFETHQSKDLPLNLADPAKIQL